MCWQCGESLMPRGTDDPASQPLPERCPHCGTTVETAPDPHSIPVPRELNPELMDIRLLTPQAPLAPNALVGMGSYAPLPRPSPPQWAPDPSGRNHWRWWNGLRWTDHVANDGVSRTDPL